VSRLAVVSFASLLLACRSHPCGDEKGSAPDQLADAPIVQTDGKTGSLLVMYWGDQRDELGLVYEAAFDVAGWKQDCGPQIDEHHYCFEKDNLMVQLHLDQSETPRLGAKMW
jgi:hypothetical protein